MTLLLPEDVFGEFEHVAGHLHARNFLEVGVLLAHLGLIAERRRLNALVARLQHQQPLAPVHHDTAKADHTGFLHGLTDDSEGLVRGVAIRHDVEGFVEIDIVDLVTRGERLDLKRMG